MNNIKSALEILRDNNEFLKSCSKDDDEFNSRYVDGYIVINYLEERLNEFENKLNKICNFIGLDILMDWVNKNVD